MQSVSSRIWTRMAVFISYGDNDYTTGTLIMVLTKTKSTLYNTRNSFGEIINKYQDCSIKKKEKIKLQNSKDSILLIEPV